MARKRQLHSSIKKAVKDWLEWHKWLVISIQQGLGCHPGVFDFYALKDGKGVWIEVKTPTDVLSKDQRKFFNEIINHDGLAIVVRSSEEVEEFLK